MKLFLFVSSLNIKFITNKPIYKILKYKILKYKMLKSVQKQLFIDQIGINLYLSNDLLDIIKSYAFYDTKTYNTICFIKEKKEEINYTFQKILLFYKFNYYDSIELHCHWGAVLHTLDENEPKLHICSDTCTNCGEYLRNVNKTYMPKKIICKCITLTT